MPEFQTAPMKAKGGSANVTGRIVEALGRAIVTEQFNTQDGFPFEVQLCEQYGASRSVVREAVKMLTAKGLLRSRQRAGTIIQPEDSWNLLDPDILRWLLERDFCIDLLIDFTETRLAIEPRAAGLAANSATGPQRSAIMKAIDRMMAGDAGEDDPLEADIAFHHAVIEASNNRFMQQFTDMAEAALRLSIRRTNVFADEHHTANHKRIATAVIEGDTPAATQLMHKLIDDALQLLHEAKKDATRAPN